jgi:hypothetical protein
MLIRFAITSIATIMQFSLIRLGNLICWGLKNAELNTHPNCWN